MSAFDIFYCDTITLFNKYNVNDSITWYATVIHNVHLMIDKAAMIATYGEQSQDNARVFIRYSGNKNNAIIESKKYVLPKQWKALNESELGEYLTFAFGNEFDFIYAGEWDGDTVIDDEDYTNGFYNYMNRKYDNVFSISNVTQYSLLPHFEIVVK